MNTIRFNKSKIMSEAHRLYVYNQCFQWTFSKCLKIAWRNTKSRLRSEAVCSQNKAYEEKRKADYRKEISYQLINQCGRLSYYNNRAYSGD